MKRLYFFQPQRGYFFDGKVSYYLPYSIGSLWSYARQNPRIAEGYDTTIIFKRHNLKNLWNQIKNPDVVAFSCYIWNWEYNKHVAKLIKEQYPNCLIIFGGPQITNKPWEHNFFREHPYVDTLINGEGEIALQNILLEILDGQKPKKLVQFTRLTELDYPSPYTSGVFDQIMAENPDVGWQAVMETNRGCPYQCTFCDWGSLTYSKTLKFPAERVLGEYTWMSQNRIEFLIMADANFGIFYDRDKEFIQHLNNLQVETGYPKTTIANWPKNAKEKVVDLAKIFFSRGKNRGFTISVQSMDEVVLEAIKRKNMDINNMEAMLKLCEEEGISTYTEMIIGLPHETRETWRANFDKLLSAGQHSSIDVFFLGMLENAELNSQEQRKEHEIKWIRLPSGVNGTSTSDGIELDEDYEIQEYERIVTETKYMSFQDLVDSYMFAHVVIAYHFAGWTQMLSRFLNRNKGISYLDFYTRLEEYIKNTPGTMNEQYYRIRNFIEQFLSGNMNLDENMKKDFHFALWRGVPILAAKSKEIQEEILELFDQDWCGLDSDLYKELKEFQRLSMYDYDAKYPIKQKFKYNLCDYIFHKQPLEKSCEIEFSYPLKWPNLGHYLEKIYFLRKRNPVRTHIKTL